jgi:hypothetical protein
MSFADLKRNRRSAIDKLVNEAQKEVGGKSSYSDDDNFWKPTVDKAGNGYAVIRFLPSKTEDELPWVQYWDHGFKGSTGRWYIEKSRTSINEADPLSEYNSYLWNTGHEEDKETARNQKRRLHYVSNIYIVSDPSAPENEGKVFRYQYGKKIFNKISDVMNPEFEDETPINPFDLWDGADFKLKIRNVEGYRNYDKSEFSSPSPLLNGDDEKLETIFNGLLDLSKYTDAKEYKSYEELLRKLNEVIGDDLPANLKIGGSIAPTSQPKVDGPAPTETPNIPTAVIDSDDEEDMAGFFEKLAKED